MGGLRSHAAGDELVGFVKECLVVDEDLYVDPEATDDVEDANHFASYKHCMRMSWPMSQSALCMYIYIYICIYKDRI